MWAPDGQGTLSSAFACLGSNRGRTLSGTDRPSSAKSGPTNTEKNMTKLLIFIGENQKFDVELATDAILAMSSTTNARCGNFVGAIFESEYGCAEASAVIRISKEAETIPLLLHRTTVTPRSPKISSMWR